MNMFINKINMRKKADMVHECIFYLHPTTYILIQRDCSDFCNSLLRGLGNAWTESVVLRPGRTTKKKQNLVRVNHCQSGILCCTLNKCP